MQKVKGQINDVCIVVKWSVTEYRLGRKARDTQKELKEQAGGWNVCISKSREKFRLGDS